MNCVTLHRVSSEHIQGHLHPHFPLFILNKILEQHTILPRKLSCIKEVPSLHLVWNNILIEVFHYFPSPCVSEKG